MVYKKKSCSEVYLWIKTYPTGNVCPCGLEYGRFVVLLVDVVFVYIAIKCVLLCYFLFYFEIVLFSCDCGHCRVLPSFDVGDCICCREIPEVATEADRMDMGMRCITEAPSFNPAVKESEEDVPEVVEVGEKLGVKLTPADFDCCHPLGSSSPVANQREKHCPLLVKFSSHRTRGLVMGARSKLKDTDIFLNDDLTPARHKEHKWRLYKETNNL